MVKIIHFSDTHLGFSDLDKTNHDGVNQREADFYQAFRDVVDDIVKIKPDYVIHTGDLFHRVSPSNRAITFALGELKRLEKLSIPLIIIAGNHSTPRTSTSSPILEALKTLDNVHSVFAQKYKPIIFDEVVFHALPHINDERLIEAELETLEAHIDPAKHNIMMMHASVGAHYLMYEFGEWVYPKWKEYLFEKMDYVALGHWHGFGRVGKAHNIYYSGSTERTGSSDKRNDKGYVVVSIAANTTVEFYPIALRPSLEYTIDATRLDEELERIEQDATKDAIVKITLTNLTSSSSIDINNQDILSRFEDAFHVKIKREFIQTSSAQTLSDIESISLEEYFVSYVEESVEDEAERVRLARKTKELFALYEEVGDDTH